MKKRFAFCCVLLAVLLGMTWLSCGVAEEFEPLCVYVHDALTMRYEVVGGSGQFEVVSTSLTDSSGAAVSPSEFKNYSYYYATVTVRDLVTGETATDTSGTQYKDPNTYSCEEGRHTAYGSEDAGDLSEKTEWVNVEYLNITETEHTVHYTTAYRCIYCNAYMFSKDSSVVETHYFNLDTGYCKCGKYDATLVCTHSNINDDDFYIHSYEIVDDNKHIEVLYKKLFCEDCRYDLGTEFWKEQTVSHFFFTGDDKCKCGYRKAPECRHIRTEKTYIDVSYTPSDTDPGIHWVVPNYKLTCLECGHVIDGVEDGSPEHHEYDENGKCVCGVTISIEDCMHEHTEQRNGATRYIPVEGDLKNHTVEHIYDTYCLNCNRVVSTLQDSWSEAHEFNQEGLCALCGYQIDPDAITEPLQVSISVWKQDAMVGDRVGADATVSGGSGNYTCHWEASSDTQKYVQSGSNYTYRSWGYNANSACTWRIKVTVTDQVTGETKTANSSAIKVKEECLHTGERLDYGKTNLVVTYDFDSSKDILRHLVIYNETPLWTCADCKQEISGETQTSLNRKDFHTFDEDTNKCVCGANRIDNFNGRLSYKLREMVEENWDPYGKWTWSYEQWDNLYHNYSLYVSDRVIGTEYAQIVADMTAIAWMVADYADQLQYEKLKLWASITGLDTSNMTYESIVEKIRANVASEQGYLAAGLTTKQVGTVANIISESVAYAQEQAIKEYYKLNDEWVDIVELIDEVANDEEIVVKGSEWLFKVINNFDGMSSAEIVEKFGEMVKVNQEVADGFGNGLDAFGVLVDLYNVTLQAATIDTFTKAHIEYMENALSSIGRDQLPLRTTLQTLINETKDQYNNDWESYFNADLPEWTGSVEVYLTQYGNLAYEEVIDIGLGMAIDSIPGVGLVTIGFSVLDMFTGDKTDDLLSYKKTYEIAEGSRDSLLSAIDALSDPLTQSQLDALKTKIVFYASSCQTLSNAYNGVIQYDAKKGLPISTSSYSGEDFIAETSAYIDLFKRY